MKIVKYTRPKNSITVTSSSSSLSSSYGAGSGLPYTTDDNSNYVVDGSTTFLGDEFNWNKIIPATEGVEATEDTEAIEPTPETTINLLKVNEEGLFIDEDKVITQKVINEWFYTDEDGNLHSRLNLVGDGEVSAFGRSEERRVGKEC